MAKPAKAKKASASPARVKSNAKPLRALVIVESPSKAKTIKKYLGSGYTVKASVGHIKDLPKSKLGVDVDKSFKPDYQIIKGKDKVVEDLKKASADVTHIYLAPDPDREGEAIAWHMAEELPKKGKKIYRVLFNSITKPAILEAIKNPVPLDENKYHSQQARRVLDRLVGYKISPLLWDKVRRGLSAGRVQSVAVRLVVEREEEIKVFKPIEYWSLGVVFEKNAKPFVARLAKIDRENPELHDEKTVTTLIDEIKKTSFTVSSVVTRERQRKPLAPFITSRLQQDASSRYGFSAKKTMTLAQKLYEGVDLGDLGTHGLITYMRTDSVRISPEALAEARAFIEKTYGKQNLPQEPVVYKSKKSAQDAHEAIRPASLEFRPEVVEKFLDKDEFRIYQLIWNRFLACQMVPAVYDQTTMELVTKTKSNREVLLRVTGSNLKFAGFTLVYTEERTEATEPKNESDEAAEESTETAQELPQLKEGETEKPREFKPQQHFTQPPPRFSDAGLIRELEEKGIGRPSTYATILSNIQDREYVEKRENRYYPSELGIVVTDLLKQAFPEIMDVAFTAEMEEQLDRVEEGKTDWVKMMKAFWKPFSKTLESAKKTMKDIKHQEIPTEHKCEKCESITVIKWGKLGQFIACSRYPECKHTAEFKKDETGKIILLPREKSDKLCEKCQSAMLVKTGRFGKFLACERYPDCKSTQSITTGIACPKCVDGELAQRMSRYRRYFYGCNKYPKCNYALWDKPVAKPCPKCKHPILAEKITKRDGAFLKCPEKGCDHREAIEQPAEPQQATPPVTPAKVA
ncbi:MAG: type I DNA topoisomerase [Bdellovibrionota bacterium]